MKSNLENNLKNAFDEYELPYNENAWASLSEKLDKLPNTSAPSSKFNLKWIIGGVAVLSITAVVIYSMNNNNSASNFIQTETAQNQVEENQNNTNGNNNENSTSELNTQSTENNLVEPNSIETNAKKLNNLSETGSGSQNTSSEGNKKVDRTTQDKTEQNASSSSKMNSSQNQISSNPNSDNSKPKEKAIVFPDIETLCEGQIVGISNKNESQLIVVSPIGNETAIEKGKTIPYKVNEAGVYTIKHKLTGQNQQFHVNEASKVDFSINDEIQYENGLPYIPLATNSAGSKFEWIFEGNTQRQYGTKAAAHFYKKGTFDITLKASGLNGCESKTVKSVTIDKDYNLLAPSGFMPLSDDYRKNKFIPYALTLRDVQFKMYIYDAKNGAVIFETNSVEGWDGYDRVTRQLVEPNTSYIWRVVLDNPNQDEPREYKGVVVRL
mgnify:CR=1 FL=1